MDPTLARRGSQFFTALVAGYRSAKVVFTANELGVFAALAGGPMTTAALSSRLGLDERTLELLLRALVGLELLELSGDGFSCAPLASAFLVPGTPSFTGHNLRFQDMLWESWGELPSVLRTGRPPKPLLELLQAEGQAFTAEYIRAMLPIAVQPARALAEALGPAPIHRLVDVGCGPGAYARALLEGHPELHATLFDLPTTLAVTRELFAESPLLARLDYREGNYLADEYGSDQDLVLLSHTTHDESPDAVEDMFRRAHRALASGGRVAVHDFVVDDATRTQPSFAALFSVSLSVYTTGGKVYSVAEYRELLERAGFRDVRAAPLLEGLVGNPTTLIVAERA